jgi:Gluconate 2-dehydrogenase subunit 3
MSETPLVEIGGLSRRELLRKAALVILSGGPLQVVFAQHVHEQVRQERASSGGAYTPKLLTDHEYKTVTRLAELIVPADGDNGSALDGGAPEFIDLLCSQNEQMADIYTGGLLWLDRHMRAHHSTDFVGASEAQQTAMLDALVAAERGEVPDEEERVAAEESATPDLAPGVHFFGWIRRMTVDAYYTSPVGIKDVGYIGNMALSEYTVPEEAIAYAMRPKPA